MQVYGKVTDLGTQVYIFLENEKFRVFVKASGGDSITKEFPLTDSSQDYRKGTYKSINILPLRVCLLVDELTGEYFDASNVLPCVVYQLALNIPRKVEDCGED
jgi:hypothetical protein